MRANPDALFCARNSWHKGREVCISKEIKMWCSMQCTYQLAQWGKVSHVCIKKDTLDMMLHAVQHAFGANQPEAPCLAHNTWFDSIWFKIEYNKWHACGQAYASCGHQHQHFSKLPVLSFQRELSRVLQPPPPLQPLDTMQQGWGKCCCGWKTLPQRHRKGSNGCYPNCLSPVQWI